MSTRIPEFTDTYSDDMIFLQSVRRSLLRHPLENHAPRFLDATLARLTSVMLVGSIENGIEQEFERTGDSRLAAYRSDIANKLKVQALSAYLNAFLDDAVDNSILDDYLAIKYLRNGIIHSDQRKGSQAEYVLSRNFPVDSRQLDFSHLLRFTEVDQAMTMYLGLVYLKRETHASAKIGLNTLPKARIATDAEVAAPLSQIEFSRIHKRNLQNVGTSWMDLLAEFPGKASPDLVAEFRAKDAEGVAPDQILALNHSAKYSWHQLVNLHHDSSARRLVRDAPHRDVLLQNIRSIAADGAFPVAPLPSSTYQSLWREFSTSDAPDFAFSDLFSGSSALTGRQLLECYALGATAYDLTAGIETAWVWPLLANGEARESLESAIAFIDLLELGRTWFAAIERHEGFDPELPELYRRGIAAALA